METNFEALSNYRDQQKVTLESIENWCKIVIDRLEKEFGVNNLSNSELFDIRRNVEWVLKQNYELASDFNKKNVNQKIRVVEDHIMGAPDFEVVVMFLSRYGLNFYDKPKFMGQRERDAYRQYLKGQLEIARQKAFNPLET